MLGKEDFLKVEGITEEAAEKLEALHKEDVAREAKSAQKEAYQNVDAALSEATGLEKERTELTAAFAKRAVSSLKNQLTDNEKFVSESKTKIASLEKQIKEGKLDEAARTKIEELEKKIGLKEETISKIRADLEKASKDHEKQLQDEVKKNEAYRLTSELSSIRSGITLKEGLDDDIRDAVLEKAERKVKSFGQLSYKEDGTAIFLDENKEPILNPDNFQKPYTLKEVYSSELKSITHENPKVTGGGGNPDAGGGKKMDLTGVSRKSEAREVINKNLAKEGISVTHKDYQAKFDEAYDTLPSDMPL